MPLSSIGLLVVVHLATGLGAILHQRRRGQRHNPQDRHAGPNVLPLHVGLLDEQNDSASVITHAEERVGLDGQKSLTPVQSTSGNGSFQS